MEKLKIHRKTHKKKYSCEKCGLNFYQRRALDIHIKRKVCSKEKYTSPYLEYLGPKQYKCKECGLIKSQAEILLIHVRAAHTMEKPFSCEICGSAFFSNASLRQHKKNTHLQGDENMDKNVNCVVCPHCGKLCLTDRGLNHHIRYLYKI